MSGIAGILSTADDQPVHRAALEQMLRCFGYRGPDGQETWVGAGIGLGHVQLHSTPESLHETQPLRNADGRLCLTADARIDNRDELRSALRSDGFEPRDNTDAELILRAYERWGEACPAKLLGDFAFAIWDERKRSLFCARDPLGMKPFFYRMDAGRFRFASMAGAFYADKATPWKPNLPLIALYLLRNFEEPEETLDEGVLRVLAGQYLVVSEGKLRKGRYWDIDPHHSIRYRTDDEYAQHFLDLFRKAVQVRLRGNGPVGSTLSGGLDSSSIVCTASELIRKGQADSKGFETFSMVFAGHPCDESQYLDAVVRKESLVHNAFPHEDLLPWLDFEQISAFPDVYYFPTLYTQGGLLQAARSRGMRAMLYGIGGDDLLTVWTEYLTDLWQQRHFGRLRTALSEGSARWNASRRRLFIRYCLRPSVPQPVKASWRWLRSRLRTEDLPDWIEPAAAHAPEVTARLQIGRAPRRFPTWSQQALYDGIFSGWNVNCGMPLIESYAAHHGLEVRCPFLDRRLVEFIFAMPTEQRGDAGHVKTLLRRAMRGILPESVRTRQDKAEFSCILNDEFTTRQASKLDEVLAAPVLADLGLIRAAPLRELFDRLRRWPGVASVQTACQHVFWLELWCRCVATNPTREPRHV